MNPQAALASLLARPDLQRVLAALADPAEETRVVGGAVRNALIGRAVHDIDLATTALPQATMRRARRAGLKAVPTGIEHGTVTVMVEGRPFEVTTLREDVETDGRHAIVRFGRDFDADARRRDFTLNALSVGPDGRLHDPVGGLADLDRRRVRFIGDAASRIREDYLRILRFFRFSAEYGLGPIDAEGVQASVRERHGLSGLSRERVGAETLKLFGAARAVETVGVLADCGLAAQFFGAVGERGRLARAAAVSDDPVRRLGAFAVGVVEDAARLRDLLRLSNADAARLADHARRVAVLKTLAEPIDEAVLRRLVVEHGPEALRDTLAALEGEPRPVVTPRAAAALDRFVSGADPVPVFPLRAADLIARGMLPGPRLGVALKQARARWLAEGCPPDTSGDALLAGLR